jgi:hypothetical protein
MWHNLKFTRRGCANTLMAVAASAVTSLTGSPVAAANVAANAPGCLPLNGIQLSASSHEDTNYFGIIYDSTVTYWYQGGAVNWHKTVDGGEFNLTHSNIFGAVPAAPGSTETIPGTGGDDGHGGRHNSRHNSRQGDETPILVTVCNQ